ncbi:MAG: PrsW family glutamic-type intramembrane protease [Bacteroidetes bacterium]|nr:PrsW family glutamic-type intramembrane protease [Bacteroidota bacterium]
MLLFISSYLISIFFWLWIILKYDKFEREPLKSILFVFIVGGLISSLPAGLLNLAFRSLLDQYMMNGFIESTNIKKASLFYAFVGINEETLKAIATILLIRKMKAFNEPADALVYSMTTAFGFSVFENIDYIIKFGFFTFFFRQFNAVPLHIGLAAIWGIGIAKAKFLHQGKYFRTVIPYLLVAMLIHSVYNSATIFFTPLFTIFILSAIGLFLVRFAIRKVIRYSEDGPFSNRLFCHSCNTVNFPDARICKKCGQKFNLEFYRLCPKCNAKVSKIAATCPRCEAGLYAD